MVREVLNLPLPPERLASSEIPDRDCAGEAQLSTRPPTAASSFATLALWVK